MDFKTNKDSKSFAFIRKHKTAFGFIAGIFIIILVVSIGIHYEKPAKSSGSQNVYYAPETKKEPVQSKAQTGSESKASVSAADKNSVKSNIEPDTWYVYKPLDLLKFQNCVIYNATTLGSKGISVHYYSVCKKCGSIQQNGEGMPRSAAVNINNPVQKMYNCDQCGETTVVRLEIKQ